MTQLNGPITLRLGPVQPWFKEVIHNVPIARLWIGQSPAKYLS
jgi:hypothetical protein